MPELIEETRGRYHVPLTSLVRDWEGFPDERDGMMAEEPQGPRFDDLCRVAAVVHALCERDGHPIPEWVWKYRSEEPIGWDRNCVMQGMLWERMLANSPPACEYHNVWFDYQFISSARRTVTKYNYREFLPA